MRTDQYIGLSRRAKDWLDKNRKPPVVCKMCNTPTPMKPEVIGVYEGMFGNKYNLHRHQLKHGYADEFLQASPWSSGPMFFIGLRINEGIELRWTDSEIREMSQ